ncbi:hypothetical protein BDN70DRAFT_991865 [Pholiota conissans]|uniref:Uncharacterized protein n=1 Tax=Pholiota conissans TaxID=109636 RepID=A0A9P6CV90_9AGAR|nr:hypothetical protein BDN70DRAFT_991865 [Pholiota conissans]
MVDRIPIFCTAEIPEEILSSFIACTEDAISENHWPESKPVDYVVFMTTLDPGTRVADNAFAPMGAFASPFLGWTLEQLRDWFRVHCDPKSGDYSRYTFIVLDDQSVKDETCLLVDHHDSTVISSLRADFYAPLPEALGIEYRGAWMEEGILGSFMRSGIVMTKENMKLAMNGGLYIERGEVKLDQAWKDFRNW